MWARPLLSRCRAARSRWRPRSAWGFTGRVRPRTSFRSTIPVEILVDVVDDYALGVDAGIGAAYAVAAHWSVVTELGALFANPVSSRGDDSRWDLLPLPPRGFFHVGLGLQYAR